MKYSEDGITYTEMYIKALDSMPIGSIIGFAGENIPNGWLVCDGRQLADELYPELHSVLGGSGLTFNLPDYRGRTPYGLDANDTSFSTLGETGGSKYLQANMNMFISSGRLYIDYKSGAGSIYTETDRAFTQNGTMEGGRSEQSNATITIQGTTDSANCLPPYIVHNWIIKATNTTPTMASVVNTANDSTEDTYSCDYVNKQLEQIGEVVWVNNRGNPFPSTSTSVSFGDYKKFKVYYFTDNHYTSLKSATVNIGNTLNISESGGNLTRAIYISSDTLYIHSGYYQGGQNNDAIIPSHIIGYK